MSPRILSDKEFEVSLKAKFLNAGREAEVEKVALLATNEYEGIVGNSGIGTYYKTLSEHLSLAGWYTILLLCHTEETFDGVSSLLALKHIFSTSEIEQVLDLQPIHTDILSEVKHDAIDYESFCCLFFTQAIASCFQESLVCVEFHDFRGIGYRTVQAKQSAILGRNCVTAVTLHGGCEWLSEVGEIYSQEEPERFYQTIYYEQQSFENADLAFFPSHYLKLKFASYKWNISGAIHLPYFIPIVPEKKSNNTRTLKISIVFFGCLEERSGIHTFIESVKLLDSNIKNQIHIYFIGEVVRLQSSAFKLIDLNSQQYIESEIGKELSYSIIANLSNEEAIEFIRDLEHPIVCLTNSQENFSHSALKIGQLPINTIASDTGGFREALELINRSSGIYWFKPRDSRSLSEAIATAVSTHQLQPQIPNRATLERINQDLLVRKIECIERAFSRLALTEYSQPKVTVGVTCYNLGRYLMECIASVETQTYKNLDVIVLDDASTDEYTQEVFNQARLLFPNYRFIQLDVNVGIGAARNHLIEQAAGDYFLPLDADNVLLPVCDRVGLYTHDLVYQQDYDFWLRCLVNQAKFFILPEQLTYYRPPVLKRAYKYDRGQSLLAFIYMFCKHLKKYFIEIGRLDLITIVIRLYIENNAIFEAEIEFKVKLVEVMLDGDVSQQNFESFIKNLDKSVSNNFRSVYNVLDEYQLEIKNLQAWSQQLQTSRDWLESQRQAWMQTAQKAEMECERSQSWNKELQAEKDKLASQHRVELEQANATIKTMESTIKAMESSKFWQLRTGWFRLKQIIGLTTNE